MRPEIIKKIESERRELEIQIPLQISIPKPEIMEEEEKSVISRVVVIDI